MRVRLPEFNRDRSRLRAALAEINHAAFLLGLRGLVDQQKFLSGLHSCPQHQKCSVRAHVDGVRFFVKRLLRRAVSVDEDGHVQFPAPAPASIGARPRRQRGRLSGRVLRASLLLRRSECGPGAGMAGSIRSFPLRCSCAFLIASKIRLIIFYLPDAPA